MLYRVFDRNGICLMSTDIEKLAKRFIDDNPERGYRLMPLKRRPVL